MKSLRNVSRACNTAAYHAITASKLAVLRTTCANFCGAIRCDAAGRVRVVAVTVLIASSICGGGSPIVSRSRRLEHAPQPHGAGRTRSEADRVVRIARGEDVGTFAAPRDGKLDDRFAAEPHREPRADAVLQMGEIELTDVLTDFAPLRKEREAERID